MASRKQHQMSVPAWIWEWGIKNDPQGRYNPAPFLRECMAEWIMIVESPGPSPAPDEDDDPTDMERYLEDDEPAPEPAPEPEKPKRPRGSMPWALQKRTGGGLADRWFINPDEKKRIDANYKVNDIYLRLIDAGGRLRYRVKYDPGMVEETDVNAHDGRAYWMLDVPALRTGRWAKEVVPC